MANKITSKIVSCKVKSNEHTEQKIELEYVHEDLKRPSELCGSTYKIKPPLYDSALYITINNIVLNKDTEYQQMYPFEIFLNSKQMESFQWVAALTRIISSSFRKGGNITHIVDELKQVFDPKGGYYYQGTWYNSVVAHIGEVLQEHMIKIGLIDAKEMTEHQKQILNDKLESATIVTKAKGQTCPECNSTNMQLLDNCPTCLDCGYSKCGG